VTGGALTWRWRLGVALTVAILAALLGHGGAISRLDNLIYDLHLSHWGYSIDDDVVTIAIDDNSLYRIGQWPWPRDVHARLLDRLEQAEVRGIALDLILAEPDRNDPAHDARLAAAMRRHGRVALPVIPTVPHQSSAPIEVLPTPMIATGVSTLGHTDVELDATGTVRGLYLHAGLGESRWPALALALLQLDPQTGPQPLPGLRRPIGQTGSPYQWVRDHFVRMRYAGPPGSFAEMSYSDVLDGRVPVDMLRGRWVVVGVTATGLAPGFQTPMSEQRMSGLEYQANVVEMLLHQRTVAPLAPLWQAGLTALIVLMTAFFILSSGVFRPLLISAFGTAAILAVSIAMLRLGNSWFAPATAIGMTGMAYLGWMARHLLLWRRQAHIDTLTLLANRRHFDLTLDRKLATARRSRSPLSLLLIDVDHFKAYNDTEGHRAGDKLLVQIASVIRRHARRTNDLAARFGGDEFAIILSETSSSGAAKVAQAILVDLREHPIRATLSIGIHTCVPDMRTLPRTMFDHADIALYSAKKNGRDGYSLHPES
jgi:diguanylate cyclase (GGDEF)-like protein